MSIWKKIGGFLKKAAPVVGTVASFIPGIGPAISTGIKALAGAGGSDNAPTKDSSPEQYGLSAAELAGTRAGFWREFRIAVGTGGNGRCARWIELFWSEEYECCERSTGG